MCVCVFSRVYQITLTLHIIKPQSRRLWRAKSEIKRNKQSSSSYSAFLRTPTRVRAHWLKAQSRRLSSSFLDARKRLLLLLLLLLLLRLNSTRLFPLDKLDKQLSALSQRGEARRGCDAMLLLLLHLSSVGAFIAETIKFFSWNWLNRPKIVCQKKEKKREKLKFLTRWLFFCPSFSPSLCSVCVCVCVEFSFCLQRCGKVLSLEWQYAANNSGQSRLCPGTVDRSWYWRRK